MAEVIVIYSENPQARLLKMAAKCLQKGGVIVIPTESSYVLCALLAETKPLERIRKLKQLDTKHQFSLMCHSISMVSQYAKIENYAHRLLKKNTPGPFTFILRATKSVPNKLLPGNQKTIGIRIPQHEIALGILELLEKPLVCTTLNLFNNEFPLSSPDEIKHEVGHAVDLIIDTGKGETRLTTIVDLTSDQPKILREGLGQIDNFITK